jgi:hypothetical protein
MTAGRARSSRATRWRRRSSRRAPNVRGSLPYDRLLERASPELEAADTSRDDVAM